MPVPRQEAGPWTNHTEPGELTKPCSYRCPVAARRRVYYWLVPVPVPVPVPGAVGGTVPVSPGVVSPFIVPDPSGALGAVVAGSTGAVVLPDAGGVVEGAVCAGCSLVVGVGGVAGSSGPPQAARDNAITGGSNRAYIRIDKILIIRPELATHGASQLGRLSMDPSPLPHRYGQTGPSSRTAHETLS
jgi:hypothetical protein